MPDHWYTVELSVTRQLQDFGQLILTLAITHLRYTTSHLIVSQCLLDWQTAVINVMWFEDAFAVSDGIECYPTPTALNTYNNLGSIQDLEAKLQMPAAWSCCHGCISIITETFLTKLICE